MWLVFVVCMFSLDSITLGWCVFRLTASNHPKIPRRREKNPTNCIVATPLFSMFWYFIMKRKSMMVVTQRGTRWSLISHMTFFELWSCVKMSFQTYLGLQRDGGNVQIPEPESFLFHIKVRWVCGRDGGTPSTEKSFITGIDKLKGRARKEGGKQKPGQKESQSANESKWFISTFIYSFM